VDGSLKIGHTYSLNGEYGINEITILLLRGFELAKGDLVYVIHPKKNLPVVYQVTRVYPHKRFREYEEALLRDGRIINDVEDSTLHAQAYQWGWMDEEGSLRPLRSPLPPNSPVYLSKKEIITQFTKPKGDWKILLGTDPSTDLDVELGIYSLIRQSCLICGAVGTGKTTTAVSMVARATYANPPVRFLIIDKDSEYSSLADRLDPYKVLIVQWTRFFQPGDIPWEDYITEFGWQKTWWNSRILFHALKILYAQTVTVTKLNLKKALRWVQREKLGFNKKYEDFENYRQQVINAVSNSKLIPDGYQEPLDPIKLLKEKYVVIMDLSKGKGSWSQKQRVVAQVLNRVFNEALKTRNFGCIIVLEEAMYYAPQRGVFEIGEKDSRNKLLGIVKEIATNGGRNGVGLWVVTQRLSTVEKTVVTQCANNVVCHSLEDVDKARIVEIMGQGFSELIGELPPGEAIVKGSSIRCKFPLWVKVLPEVYPASSTNTPLSRFIHMEMAQGTGQDD
jgi:DNA helicase HerA-like ATPase